MRSVENFLRKSAHRPLATAAGHTTAWPFQHIITRAAAMADLLKLSSRVHCGSCLLLFLKICHRRCGDLTTYFARSVQLPPSCAMEEAAWMLRRHHTALSCTKVLPTRSSNAAHTASSLSSKLMAFLARDRFGGCAARRPVYLLGARHPCDNHVLVGSIHLGLAMEDAKAKQKCTLAETQNARHQTRKIGHTMQESPNSALSFREAPACASTKDGKSWMTRYLSRHSHFLWRYCMSQNFKKRESSRKLAMTPRRLFCREICYLRRLHHNSVCSASRPAARSLVAFPGSSEEAINIRNKYSELAIHLGCLLVQHLGHHLHVPPYYC